MKRLTDFSRAERSLNSFFRASLPTIVAGADRLRVLWSLGYRTETGSSEIQTNAYIVQCMHWNPFPVGSCKINSMEEIVGRIKNSLTSTRAGSYTTFGAQHNNYTIHLHFIPLLLPLPITLQTPSPTFLFLQQHPPFTSSQPFQTAPTPSQPGSHAKTH
jgi:hypothetical protein